MLGDHGETLVVDWGLAKLKGKETALLSNNAVLKVSSGLQTDQTLPGSIVGTPGFMSPEQAEGRLEDLAPATDIYGLGATLFVLLTGQRAIPGRDTREILQRTARGEILKPREVQTHLPKPLEAICVKAMALSANDRYSTCEVLAEDVENFLSGEPVSAYAEPWRDRARRWVRKHRTVTTSAVVAVSVAFVGLIIGLTVVSRLNRELDEKNTQLAEAVDNQKR